MLATDCAVNGLPLLPAVTTSEQRGRDLAQRHVLALQLLGQRHDFGALLRMAFAAFDLHAVRRLRSRAPRSFDTSIAFSNWLTTPRI